MEADLTESAAGRIRAAPEGTAVRYGAVAQTLHWVTALLMLTAVVLAWVFMALPDTASSRFGLITLHKSIGQTIFLLAVVRLAWRWWHPPPPLVGRMARWEAAAARVSHWLLYWILLLMPTSGILLASAAARPSPYFWLFYWPPLPLVPWLAHAALSVHLAAQFMVYAFVGLHVAAALWHLVVRRDGTLERMLPPQRSGPA
jgi:cytochrome b561